MSEKYQGWMRPMGSHGPFEKVEAATGDTRAQVYNRLMELTELRAGEGRFEFQIMEGKGVPRSEQYRHRAFYPNLRP